MVCLDTTFLIDLLKGKEGVRELKESLYRMESSLAVPAPAVMELWLGACLAKASDAEKEKVRELLASLDFLSLDEDSAREAGEIEAGLLLKGSRIQTEDIMIAAIARTNGCKVVTRDAHFTRIPGLRVLKY